MDEVESAIVSVSGDVDAAQAEEWFGVLCEVFDDFGENWNLFKDALATRAYEKSFPRQVAENFVEYMEAEVSDQTDVLRQIRERRDSLPQLYASLVAEEKQALAAMNAEQHAAVTPAVSELGWVTEKQRALVEGRVGPNWQEFLRTKLDENWKEWRAATPDGLQQWLDGWAESILPPKPPPLPSAAAPPDVTKLTWVTASQRAKLESGVGPNWPDFVRAALDDKWPPWRGASPEGLVGFLNDWADALIAEKVPPRRPARAPESAVSELGWLTNEQRALVEDRVGPKWRDFLRTKLDENWTQWKAGTPDGLRQWLDGWAQSILPPKPPPLPPRPAPPAPPPPPPRESTKAAAPAQSAKQIETSVIADVLSKAKVEYALPQQELERLITEVMRERVAARGASR